MKYNVLHVVLSFVRTLCLHAGSTYSNNGRIGFTKSFWKSYIEVVFHLIF